MANYIKATNFAAKDALPTGDAAKIIKGTEIDVEYTAIATAIASKADTNSPTFTGTPTAPTATAGTSNTQIATTAFVTAAASSSLPSGVIVMWSGSIATIPSGFYLCDGSNGTPNLRDRFIIGAGSSYAVGGTGGSKDAVVVAHTHTASTNSTGSHTHTIEDVPYRANDTDRGSSGSLFSIDDNTTRTTSSAGSHSHTVTVNSTGSSGTNANLPPYYALAYIMKA